MLVSPMLEYTIRARNEVRWGSRKEAAIREQVFKWIGRGRYWGRRSRL
jgi:hypothetical protein